MSMMNGLAGGMLGGLISSLGDDLLSGNKPGIMPIPAFYFEADFYSPDGQTLDGVDVQTFDPNKTFDGLDDGMATNLLVAAASGLGVAADALNPGEQRLDKSFIEISGLETGLEGKKTFNAGGYNYPIDLPDKMKNSAITLKRLIRPESLTDKWRKWCEHTFEATAMWNHPIQTMIVQVNVFHPNINPSGDPYVLMSINFFDAYPSKMTMSALNSTSEDVLVEEIEISYSSVTNSYDGTF